jgi:hypothetical protein
MATAIKPTPDAESLLIEQFRSAFHALSELAQHNPAGADVIAATIAAQLRSAFPMQVVTPARSGVRTPIDERTWYGVQAVGTTLLFAIGGGRTDALLSVAQGEELAADVLSVIAFVKESAGKAAQ